jgi:hypothetical protein
MRAMILDRVLTSLRWAVVLALGASGLVAISVLLRLAFLTFCFVVEAWNT